MNKNILPEDLPFCWKSVGNLSSGVNLLKSEGIIWSAVEVIWLCCEDF